MDAKAYKPSEFIVHRSPGNNQISLTYDFDDFQYIGAPYILNTLRKYNVKATFFLTGRWVECHSELAKRVASEGHQIGNHSYEHPVLTKISHDNIIESILKAEETIKNVIGLNPQPFFREPYGAWNQDVLKAVGEAGYKYSIYWSIDTLDWKQPPVDVIVKRILGNVKGGDIVLMHGHGKNTAAATDIVINKLKASGFELVTIRELLNL